MSEEYPKREQSGSHDIIALVTEEVERRTVKGLRADIHAMSKAMHELTLEVQTLKVHREADTTSKALGDITKRSDAHEDRLRELERYRAFAAGAVAVLLILATSIGFLSWQTLTSIDRDVAVLKANSEQKPRAKPDGAY